MVAWHVWKRQNRTSFSNSYVTYNSFIDMYKFQENQQVQNDTSRVRFQYNHDIYEDSNRNCHYIPYVS